MMKYLLSLIVLLTSHLYLHSQSHKCETSIDYGNNPDSGQYAHINDIDIYYETYGDPSKPCLLLIHGNGGSVSAGRCQIEYFKDDYYVLVVDSRYQGKSGDGDQELTYRLMTDDYYQLLNQLNLNSVNIIGQSDGGIIGLMLAIEHPEKVNKLIAAAPNLRPNATALHQWSIDEMHADLKKVEDQIKAGDTSHKTLRRKALITKMIKYPNIEIEELKKIKSPVLLVFGDSDYMPFAHILEMYEHIPKSNLFIVPGAGHRTYRLEPDLFNLMSERFFSNPFSKASAKDGY